MRAAHVQQTVSERTTTHILATRSCHIEIWKHVVQEDAAVKITQWRDGLESGGKLAFLTSPKSDTQKPHIPGLALLPKVPSTKEAVRAMVAQFWSAHGLTEKQTNSNQDVIQL